LQALLAMSSKCQEGLEENGKLKTLAQSLMAIFANRDGV
jgi:hypothetical protein